MSILEVQDVSEINDLNNFNAQIDSVSSASKEFLKQPHAAVGRMYIQLLIVGIPCWIIAWKIMVWLLPVAFASQDSHGGDVLLFPLCIAGLPFIIPISFYSRITAHMQKLFNTQVAAALGLIYSTSAPISSVRGHLFSVGDPFMICNVFSGQYRGLPIRLFTYIFTTGSGKNRVSHSYTCCEMRLPTKTIELFVISRTLRDTANVTWQPLKTHPLRTEGELNDIFDIYVQDGNDIEGLQILEPNVILELKERFTSFGFECCEDRVIVFTHTQPDTKGDFKKLIGLADTLYDILIPEVATVTPTPSI
jgi:hypothetical protein